MILDRFLVLLFFMRCRTIIPRGSRSAGLFGPDKLLPPTRRSRSGFERFFRCSANVFMLFVQRLGDSFGSGKNRLIIGES